MEAERPGASFPGGAPFRLAAACALVSSVVFGACTSGGRAKSDPAMPAADENVVIPITVNNNLSPRTNVTVRLISGGVTRILGGVGGDRERTFQVDTPALTGEHRLSATGTDLNRDLLSQPFTLFANSSVRWTLVSNSLLVGEQLDEPQPESPDR